MYDYLFNFCVLFHCSFVQMVIDLSWSSLFSRRSYNRCVHPILSSSVISFRWCCRFYTSSSSSHFFLDPITFISVISSIRFFLPVSGLTCTLYVSMSLMVASSSIRRCLLFCMKLLRHAAVIDVLVVGPLNPDIFISRYLNFISFCTILTSISGLHLSVGLDASCQ